MQEERKRRKRNKPTHYDKDIHIRIHEKYVEKIREEADKRGITQALMTRLIIEAYFNGDGITISMPDTKTVTSIPKEDFTVSKEVSDASLQNAKDMLEWLGE